MKKEILFKYISKYYKSMLYLMNQYVNKKFNN
jgi:hypothetical protein